MNKVWNLGRIGIAAICCLLMTTLFSSCEETYIHADRAMPGMWVIEDIYDISPEGLVDMPFRIGDEVEFVEDGCLFLWDGRYEHEGNWWVEEHFNATYICIKMEGYRDPIRGRISDVYAGRVVWSIYPHYVSDYWMGEPVTELTFRSLE